MYVHMFKNSHMYTCEVLNMCVCVCVLGLRGWELMGGGGGRDWIEGPDGWRDRWSDR